MNTTRLLACDHPQSVLRAGHQAIAYSAYGYRSPVLPAVVPGFNGELADTLTGHYLLGNGYRAYNPVLMRFNSPDSWSPFGRGGPNAYGYCLGDPVNRRDPGGHASARREAAVATQGDDLQTLLVVLGVVVGFLAMGAGVLGWLRVKAEHHGHVMRVSLTRGSSTAPPSPARAHLREGLEQLQTPAPFTRAVRGVNDNMISHGHGNLPIRQADAYIERVNRVETGQISNTTAHLQSASGWARVEGAEGRVGMLMNTAAGFLSGGSTDGPERQTGRAIRRASR
ncbi:RHS repeat-associated core domain-containing protein [Pseudomonas sp. zfem002]|uniref:RHS repeat-associated core domain-containing protein n=1 Tax=Pseudomonas sp. zfem002 TaxID=3078197 RepID=UPI002927B0D6|nr:RHS repeat-associated core domain-containing protein [Pseudomonas sp. zfem002]MDU9392469.1 RHS repeat-associated core domain-containing protein [Pseudomonas sp. zfem002]